MQISTIGANLAKNVFQVHGVDSAGNVVITRQLRRKKDRIFWQDSCLPGFEPTLRSSASLRRRDAKVSRSLPILLRTATT
jgi:transposase